jgi:hypothetical protein
MPLYDQWIAEYRVCSEMGDARFSPCRTWRYSLSRDLDAQNGRGVVTFIGLNPSTADAVSGDPTTRRCIGFARSWGFSRMHLINVYAFRATNPRIALKADDPVGPENADVVHEIVGASDLVICAWGVWGVGPNADAVVQLLSAPHCLGHTKLGAPRHPLYVKACTAPTPFVQKYARA